VNTHSLQNPESPRPARVLIIEDESIVAATLEDMLDDLGFEVVGVAARLAEAMRVVQDGSFDGAILDVNLDGEASYPVADVLRTRGIPFVFTTGYGKQGLAAEFRHAAVLTKPFSQDELNRVLAQIGLAVA
jgi:CheY-like chemotaxis protein